MLLLIFLQVAVVSFGRRVSWKKTIPKWFINTSIIHVILMGIVTTIKLIFQVCMYFQFFYIWFPLHN